MEWKKNIVIGLLLLCVGGLLSMMLTRSCNKPKETITEIVKTDTLTIARVDTSKYYNPTPISEIVTGIKVSFQPYAFVDNKEDIFDTPDSLTSYLNNLGLNLDMQYDRWVGNTGQTFYHTIKQYRDSTYTLQISGINANLDWIETYNKIEYKYITTTEKVYEKPKKWGFGPTVGVGVVNNKFYPYIGVGVTYNIIQW